MSLVQRRVLASSSLTLFAVATVVLVLWEPVSLAEGWGVLLREVQTLQRELLRGLADAMGAAKSHETTAAWTLIVLSFLYGVFHAAGPGHGKVVISTYLLTQENELRRGLVLSLVASLCQGLTAILLVAATVGLLDLSMRDATGAATNLEVMSYGLVALVGMTLVASRIRRLWRRRRGSVLSNHNSLDHHHVHDHQDHSDEGGGALGCSSCGHAHGPSRSDLEAPLSWRGTAGMILSVGLRPCSGAILVLLLAYSMDLRLVGAAAVFAMSIGTAITVSILAVLSVFARKLALRFVEEASDQSVRATNLIDLVGLLGGVVLFILGLLMLQASWNMASHPLF